MKAGVKMLKIFVVFAVLLITACSLPAQSAPVDPSVGRYLADYDSYLKKLEAAPRATLDEAKTLNENEFRTEADQKYTDLVNVPIGLRPLTISTVKAGRACARYVGFAKSGDDALTLFSVVVSFASDCANAHYDALVALYSAYAEYGIDPLKQ